jgi:hypothetical protein
MAEFELVALEHETNFATLSDFNHFVTERYGTPFPENTIACPYCKATGFTHIDGNIEHLEICTRCFGSRCISIKHATEEEIDYTKGQSYD